MTMNDRTSQEIDGNAVTPASLAPDPMGRRGSPFWGLVRKYTLLLAMIVAIAFFSALRPGIFPTTANATSILATNAPTVLISVGAMIPFVVNQFDLTPAYTATLSALLVAGFQSFNHWPFPLAIIVTLLICLAIGAVNGLLVAYAGFSSIIVTIGTGGLLMGAAEIYANSQTIYEGISRKFDSLGQGGLFGIPLPFIYAAVLSLVVWYVLSYRPMGRRMYAVGANVDAAKLVKIRVRPLIFGSFLASAFLSGLGGIMVAAQAGSADPDGLNYLLLPAFTAVFLGATSIRPGHYNVWGTVIAVYLVGAVTTGLFMLGAPPNYEEVVQGMILLVAVGLAKLSTRQVNRASR
jgi:ribose transport system permease protein